MLAKISRLAEFRRQVTRALRDGHSADKLKWEEFQAMFSCGLPADVEEFRVTRGVSWMQGIKI